jgi:hypothetical protein
MNEGMQKIKRGKTFNGLISYLLKPASHHKSDPYVIGGNVMESFAEALSAEFNTKALRPMSVNPFGTILCVCLLVRVYLYNGRVRR